jgi:TrmH family RNA methyltransferase
MLDSIRVVLSHPQHPGNIGACARAMKTMGLSDLRLVNPREFPSEEANMRARGGLDVLGAAHVHSSLVEAIAECELVIGTSARERSLDFEVLNPREMADRIANEAAGRPVAILFGRENNGLDNDELSRCHFHVMVPANPQYSSLNIGSAVQIMAYELRMRSLANLPEKLPESNTASAEQLDQFFVHLEDVLKEIDFLKPTASTQLMPKFRRLYLRAKPTIEEINILRGVLRATRESVKTPRKP